MEAKILAALERLEAGQAELRAGQKELQAGQKELRAEVKELQDEVRSIKAELSAVHESVRSLGLASRNSDANIQKIASLFEEVGRRLQTQDTRIQFLERLAG